LWLGLRLSGRPSLSKSGDRSAPTESFAMTVHGTTPLTGEGPASLIEVALALPNVAMTGNDPRAGADGSMRITEVD
jgi:hypothetical protein